MARLVRERLFEELKGAPENAILWHFTGPQGAASVIGSQKFLATLYRDLADKEEIQYGWHKFQEVLRDWENAGGPAGLVAGEMLSWDNPFGNGWDAYVASFCMAMNDHLWEHYAEQGTGSALGVSYESMRHAADRGQFPLDVIVRVVYEPRDQVNLVREIIGPAFDYLENDAPGVYDDKTRGPNHLAQRMWERLIPLILSMKDPKWCKEEEWRRVWIQNPRINRKLHGMKPVMFKGTERLPIPFGAGTGLEVSMVQPGKHATKSHREEVDGLRERMCRRQGV